MKSWRNFEELKVSFQIPPKTLEITLNLGERSSKRAAATTTTTKTTKSDALDFLENVDSLEDI